MTSWPPFSLFQSFKPSWVRVELAFACQLRLPIESFKPIEVQSELFLYVNEQVSINRPSKAELIRVERNRSANPIWRRGLVFDQLGSKLLAPPGKR
jgi:hypothetical protein